MKRKTITNNICRLMFILSLLVSLTLLKYYIPLLKNNINQEVIISLKNDTPNISYSINAHSLNSTPTVKSDVETIEEIAREVAESYSYREYGLYWDCTKYSMDLVYALREQNYTAERAYGIYRCDEKPELHEWVIVFLDNKNIHIEATGGFLIPDEMYEKCYEFRHYHPVP